MPKFIHGLSAEFIAQLAAEANINSWWADALNDPKLFVAVRHNYLNVYWRGQSLFRVKPGLKVTTHVKFLVDPKLADQVSLAEGKFDVGGLLDRGLVSRYEGPPTLAKMKTAAGLFAGPEKTGSHEIAVNNPDVIDCEIAFPGIISPHDGGPDETAGRVDLLSLQQDRDTVRLVFWEAKHYSNPELRAKDGRAVPVCDQVKRYKKYLCDNDNRKAVADSYTKVAANLVAIRDMGLRRPLSPLITEVGTGKRSLTLDPEPRVGLVIFGFDQAEKVYPDWKRHLGRLKHEVAPVVAGGDAKNIRLKL